MNNANFLINFNFSPVELEYLHSISGSSLSSFKGNHFLIPYLVRQHLRPGLLSLLLVDELHEDPLVLEHVTLGLQVQLMVQVAINLLGLPTSMHVNYQFQ